MSTTSSLGHKSLYLGCTRATLSLKALLHACPIDISAFVSSTERCFLRREFRSYLGQIRQLCTVSSGTTVAVSSALLACGTWPFVNEKEVAQSG